MLLYAATRILPPGFTEDLTFSTFEPSHRGIRDYKLATVVGTYLGGAGKALDPELGSARGFLVDTVQPAKSSPECGESAVPPAGVPELIELAANGEWEVLDYVHQL